MDGRPSHYDVLGVSKDATYDEIKVSFHRLARAKHPDKQNKRQAPQHQHQHQHQLQQQQQHQNQHQLQHSIKVDDHDRCETEADKTVAEFRRVQQAWQVLRDPEERGAYDSDLLHKDLQEENRRSGAIVLSYHEDLEEVIDEETNEPFMVYDCRCGEEIHIDECPPSETDGSDDILLDCPGCCFVYRIVGK
mmetsp:Transcript_6916/g.14688  ORF Transcript_6916/g.14688 Transcript_6916/m.14688 type:complete len:191 (+) Transcript_6916:170-742(+)